MKLASPLKLVLSVFLLFSLLLTGCLRNAPASRDATWNEAQWDNSTWQ